METAATFAYLHSRDLMFVLEALGVAALGLRLGLLLRVRLRSWMLVPSLYALFLALAPYGSARADMFDTLQTDASDKGGKLCLIVGTCAGVYAGYKLMTHDHRVGWKAVGMTVAGLVVGLATTGGQLLGYAHHLVNAGF